LDCSLTVPRPTSSRPIRCSWKRCGIIVGLYLSPPERAIVLCVDEKSQVQALDRTQPLLPMRPGQAERRTHDYKRHGTTSLFAALDVKARIVVGKCMQRHRAQEFRKFLDEVERNVPADLDVHVVMDDYETHKTKLIPNWLAKRRAGMCTTRRRRLRGSIRSNASSRY
jgi:transposase